MGISASEEAGSVMGCQFKYWVVTDRVLIDFLDLISCQLDMDRWFVFYLTLHLRLPQEWQYCAPSLDSFTSQYVLPRDRICANISSNALSVR